MFDVVEAEEVEAKAEGIVDAFTTEYYDCVVVAKFEKSTNRMVHANYMTSMKLNVTIGKSNASMEMSFEKDYTITYYPQQYSITYNLNGGTIVSSRPNTYIYGQVTNLPTKVMKDGYTFIGWYEDKECLNKKITSIDTDRNENITLYAKWSDTKYNITYISNNEDITSTLDAAKEVVYGTTYELPVLNSTTTTYFAGWYNNPEFAGTSITHTPIHPEDNLTYYAKWTTNNAKQITYVLDGGAFVGTYPTYYTEGSPIYLSQNVKKEGYYFRGQYDNPQFDGEIINTIKATDTGDKTFYAKWTPVYYNISYDTDGGTIIGISTSSYVYGTIVKFPTNVVKDGYVFTGWKDVETKNIVTETTSTQLGHIKLEAQYTVAKYPLILDANGGLFDEDLFDDNQANYSQYTKMLQYKEIYGTLPTPYRKGYNFEKWSTSKNGVPEVSAETIYTATTESGITISFNPFTRR